MEMQVVLLATLSSNATNRVRKKAFDANMSVQEYLLKVLTEMFGVPGETEESVALSTYVLDPGFAQLLEEITSGKSKPPQTES